MSLMVGLTGGIGSGKSTVAAVFEKLGATVIDADAIVHEIQAPGTPLVAEIAEAFGDEVVDERGALDREALGAIVFRDEAQRQRLNAIVHPKVGAEFARRVAAARDSGVPLIVLDIPLFFETRRSGGGTSSAMHFDATVLAWVPVSVQIERTMSRDGCSREEAQRRVDAQMPLDEKRDLADHVVDNSGPLEETEAQVRAIYEALLGGAPA